MFLSLSALEVSKIKQEILKKKRIVASSANKQNYFWPINMEKFSFFKLIGPVSSIP